MFHPPLPGILKSPAAYPTRQAWMGRTVTQRQLALLIDRASSRLGAGAVLRSELTADPLPERAVRYQEGVRSQGPGVGGRFAALYRPLLLHSPPQPLDVLSVVPYGPPVSFRWQGRMHRVAQAWGPERIEAGWWRGRSARRDYWRVETESGQRFWLFRDLTGGTWQLHGEFA